MAVKKGWEREREREREKGIKNATKKNVYCFFIFQAKMWFGDGGGDGGTTVSLRCAILGLTIAMEHKPYFKHQTNWP